VNTTARYWLVAGLLSVLASIWLLQRGTALRPSVPLPKPLAVVPAGPAFVLTLDLARLRKTPTGLELARAGAERLEQSGKTCGFEPLRDVDEIVVVVPADAKLDAEGAVPSETVAVIAGGRFVGPVVADCVARQIAARGGEPVRTTIGAFASVRDRKRAGEIAVRNGLLVLSDGRYLRSILDAAAGHRSEGSEAERVRDRLHSELRRTFGAGAPIIATVTLPEGWLAQALADPEAERSPLASIRSAALSANVSDRVELRALFACAQANDCDAVERFLKQARSDLSQVLGPEIAQRIAELRLERAAERITLTGTLDAAQVKALFSSTP
jgi:hypothetical protein